MSSPSNTAAALPVRFLAFEGVDGSGKTTQAARLAAWLQAQGHEVVLTREPGGTVLGERLRAMILDANLACTARAELLMITAARAQHLSEVIAPALAAGRIVVTDRFSLSSLAYQGFGRGIPLEQVTAANAVATGGVRPDLTFVLEITLEELLARVGERRDRFEGEGCAFLQRVIAGYHCLGAVDNTVQLLDGAGTVEAVELTLRQQLAGRLPALPGEERRTGV